MFFFFLYWVNIHYYCNEFLMHDNNLRVTYIHDDSFRIHVPLPYMNTSLSN